MEVANLQNQIAIDNANNKFLANLYENVITMRTRRGPPGIEGPMVIPSTTEPETRNPRTEIRNPIPKIVGLRASRVLW